MAVDFPRAWQIARATPIADHHFLCSYRVSQGGVLCDCDVLIKHHEYTDTDLHLAGDRVAVDGAEWQAMRAVIEAATRYILAYPFESSDWYSAVRDALDALDAAREGKSDAI